MWGGTGGDAPPQLHRCFHIHLPPHPCAETEGGCFPHPPAAGMCPGRSPSPRCSHPKLALLEFKRAGMSWGARRGDCAHTSPARGVLEPLSGAPQTLWSWERGIPAGIIPPTPHPSMARPPHGAKPRRGARGGVWGRRSPSRRSPAFPQPRWFFMERAGFQLGPGQNQPIRYSPDLRLGFTEPAVPGWREGKMPKATVPALPSPGPSRTGSGAVGVRALVGEQRLGLHCFGHGRRFPAPKAQAAPRKAQRAFPLPGGSPGAKPQPSAVAGRVQETLRVGSGGMRNRERHPKASSAGILTLNTKHLWHKPRRLLKP